MSTEPHDLFTKEEEARLIAEDKANERMMREEGQAIAKHNKEWRVKWPNHCEACGGWGGQHYAYDPSPAGVGLSPGCMYDVDVCEALPPKTCHRCGEAGLDEDGDGPCSNCGWNYDDGLRDM